jgi:Domain of Unknown Function (DUF928)
MKFKNKRSHQLISALIIYLLLYYYLTNELLAASKLDTKLTQKRDVPATQTPSKRPENRKPFRFKLPNDGAPGNRVGAATRGVCLNDKDKPPLTALIPGKNMGLTISDRPTFWFYLPYQANSTTPVKFTLTNTQGKAIYEQNVRLLDTPGVIGVTLPNTAPSLEVDKIYEWKLAACDADSVIGRIKRITASDEVMNQLQTSTGRDRLLVYAENSFWYDTIAGLIELRLQNPQDEDLKADWQDLLKSPDIDLGNIASEPIGSCCKSK